LMDCSAETPRAKNGVAPGAKLKKLTGGNLEIAKCGDFRIPSWVIQFFGLLFRDGASITWLQSPTS